jgi:membrane protease YdiL (CAAX protease family)
MADSESESKSGAEPEVPLEVPATAETPRDETPAPVFSTEANRRSPGLEKLYLAGRVLLYLFLCLAVAPPAVYSLVIRLFGRQRGGISAEFLIFAEVLNFALIVGLTLLIAVAERTPWTSYGLPWKEAFRANFWVGMLLGLAEASVLIGLIELLGGFSLEAWALEGRAIFGWGLLHFALFTFVGLYEEFLFRGYPQFALSKVIGFWPAAILLSAGFGLVHKSNPGETWVGVASVALVGLLFAFTLKRTGNLWYAVGLHAGFDWAQSFLYSVPDSGELLQGHLWDSSLHGPVWLTGGSVGPEGSVFCFLTMGLQFLVVLWLFPEKSAVREPAVSTASD